MLWVLIRSASYPQYIFSWRNKKNIRRAILSRAVDCPVPVFQGINYANMVDKDSIFVCTILTKPAVLCMGI